MPFCGGCNKSQARFKNDGGLCTTCFNNHNVGQVKSRDDNVESNGNDNTIDNNAADKDHFSSIIDVPEGQKIGDLSTVDYIKLLSNIIKPIDDKLIKINENLTSKIHALEKRVDILEKEDSLKSEKLSILTSTVTNMQQAINSIDSKERSRNIIISGLSEEDIQSSSTPLHNDVSKVNSLFRNIGINDIIINSPSQLQRIGKDPNNEKKRFLKITLADYKTRERIIENARKLKDLPEPWNKIFINRDYHPVYQKEHNRLRKKFNEIRRNASNTDDIKLIKGELFVNKTVVDRNIFLK